MFIEVNHKYFYPPDNLDHYRFDVEGEHELVENVDPQIFINPTLPGGGAEPARHPQGYFSLLLPNA